MRDSVCRSSTTHKELALGHSDNPPEDKEWSSVAKSPVATTLSVSVDQITHSDVADYLSLAACVARKDVSIDLLQAVLPQTREDAIKVLERYALVMRVAAGAGMASALDSTHHHTATLGVPRQRL
jgi:hypothetical protein